MNTKTNYIASAQTLINKEIEAIKQLLGRIGDDFVRAIDLILECRGRVILMGMGKSGHIGNKIAASLASTGTPAFFVHPGEASHGDLGMVTSDDVVIAISSSGTAHELTALIPLLKRKSIPLIGMTGNMESPLAQESDAVLDISVESEACPLGLAPTSSTTVTLVMGDALTVALLEARGFTAEEFAFSHPGGALGRKLLLRTDDLMHVGDAMPIVQSGTLVSEALLEMSQKGLGMTGIIDDNKTLIGLFTDGDLRRLFEKEVDFRNSTIDDFMTPKSFTIKPGSLAAETVAIMEEKNIYRLFVVNDAHQPVGAIHVNDLLKAGVV